MFEYACHEGNYGMEGTLSGARAIERDARSSSKGPVKNKFAFLGVEAPGWQGARREHPGSIRPTSNAARQNASAAENGK